MKPFVLTWNALIEEFLFLRDYSRTGIVPILGKLACNDVFEGNRCFYGIL